MDTHNLVFAYFGPETVLPMTSVIATIVGLIMMFGRHSLRLIVGSCRFIIRGAGRMIRPSSGLYQGPHASRAGCAAIVVGRPQRGQPSNRTIRPPLEVFGASGRSSRIGERIQEGLSVEGEEGDCGRARRPRTEDRRADAGGRRTAEPGTAPRRRAAIAGSPRRRPAQTPVAWSTFATGINPGGHGIFDFLRRDPATLPARPRPEPLRAEESLPPPQAVNLRRGTTVWDLLPPPASPRRSSAAPAPIPPDRLRGRMLSGMGVPDLRGGLGPRRFTRPTRTTAPRESENVVRSSAAPTARSPPRLIGPRNPRSYAPTSGLELAARSATARAAIVDPVGRRAEGDRSRRGAVERLAAGQVQGRACSSRSAGMVRFHLIRLEPALDLYASPVNFDPEAPLFPISHPPSTPRELADEIGLFHTTGMVEDHTGLINERHQRGCLPCPVRGRLARARGDDGPRAGAVRRRASSTASSTRPTAFNTCSGVSASPSTRPMAVPIRTRATPESIDDHYRRGDEVVGQVLDHVDDQTLLDRPQRPRLQQLSSAGSTSTAGCSSRAAGSHRTDCRPAGVAAGDFLRSVDWSRTQAYALGLSGLLSIFRAAKARGSSSPRRPRGCRRRIAEDLTGLRDPGRDAVAIRSARAREQVYSGPFVAEAPDVIVDYERGYRVSWTLVAGRSRRPATSRTTPRSGAATTSSIPRWSPGSCS